ncbi:hypothetical protein HA402_003386 [Bradysia odoriphaga]|nr:hypothetical protein HA402_003386 [Bradysia odoriphaga]
MIGLQEFEGTSIEPPEKPLKKWKTKFEGNILTAQDFIQYFQTASPFFFNEYTKMQKTVTIDQAADFSDLGRCSFDEQAAKCAIIDAVEEFICGDNPQTVLEKLRLEGNVSSVCGQIFKVGEPTYSCRECGMDQTCVLCVNCFKQSAHRNHKYKMGTSSGGGCCDCGDVEAWKRDPYCDEHNIKEEKIESSIITERMRERCLIVFDAIMNYCVRSLEIETDGSMRGCEGFNEEDFYCTVLYNDETHTFEQVIQTLTRIVGCNQKEAVEYVSSIDREGRAVVKCATFQACLKLKQDIEKQTMRTQMITKTTALKVAVLHKKAVAYQQFALQLLSWFQDFLSRHAVFRKLFCEVATQQTSYNLNHILLNDFKLWKTARASWHRLLISGMLMEYENKKTLAILFTKLYPSLMQEFIRDDHEHSFSVVSLSVQIFTVPTIAQHLIAHESAFFKLMHTFYSESIEKYVKKKILQFAKNTANMNVFKRAAYTLFDLKYLLSFKPDVWTDDLRKNFLHGFQILLKLLKEMQGMDSVHRQTGQHMEYEPEWESAFNLHIKLAHVITLILDWCSTDKVVLVKVYRMVLASLSESEFIVSQATKEVKELADHSATCLMYDVSAKHVSIHLPLSRFFAGLYLHLEKFGLNYELGMGQASPRTTPDLIIEPVLCTQTMIAQVHSGLWRRNGYSLLNQLYFYRNVRCRAEMLDRDIVLLQIGASLIESNEFLIHVINKFNLISWAAVDFEVASLINPEEDSIRQIINMVDEMLETLIVIIGERYVPGIGVVTEVDKLKKEIIQQLCIKPFSHSELSKTLPESQHENGMESVIDAVAVFKKPTQSDKKGVYELKPEFFEDYNMYYYHYTKEEKSKSEEAQRKRRKDKNDLVCCPPPMLPQLTQSFSLLANLLQCDVMLLIMQTVLKRALDLKARSFSDSHLQKVLHLIGYAVQEQKTGFYPFFTFYDRASKWNILQLMEELVSSVRVEAHRDLLIWAVKAYKDLQPRASTADEMESEEIVEPSMSAAEVEKAEKEERARLAAECRAKIMAQMASAQRNFMSTNAELFESTAETAANRQCSMEWLTEPSTYDLNNACLGTKQKQQVIEDQRFTCILCSEDSTVTKDGPCMVYSSFIQQSNVLHHDKSSNPSPHSGSCGHVMHASCWKDYFDNEVLKENRRPNRNRSPGSFIIDKKEFLCPLCRCLSNAVLPITPALCRFNNPPIEDPEDYTSFEEWIAFMKSYNTVLHSVDDNMLQNSLDHIEHMPSVTPIIEASTTTVEKFSRICKPLQRALISADLKNLLEEFINSVRRVAPYPYASVACEPYIATWLSCLYTIETLEMYLRAINKPLKGQMSIRHISCLSGLIRVCGLLPTCISDQNAATLISQLRSILDSIFDNQSSSVTEWNIFKMLVSLLFITPSVIYAKTQECSVPSGSMFDFYYLKLMFLANLTKIFLLMKLDPSVFEVGGETSTEFMDVDSDAYDGNELIESPLIDFYVKFNCFQRENGSTTVQATRKLHDAILENIKAESSTFLRCSCLLFHFMTDVELPDQLANVFGDTFEVMCEYLGLSTDIESYLSNKESYSFMSSLANHKDIDNVAKSLRGNGDSVIYPCVPNVKRFIDLPDDYSDLINSVSSFTCPNNDRDDTRNPSMCLVCGDILCSMTYCCQKEMINNQTVGACTYHAQECGAGVGIFLRIRDCEIVLLGLSKGSLMSAPYLDEYGETDQGLRRGNPLHLCKERLNKLHLMWLGHSLHEEIARTTEITNSLIATQWHNM